MLKPELRTSDDGDAFERRALACTGDGVGERDTRPKRLHDLVPTDPLAVPNGEPAEAGQTHGPWDKSVRAVVAVVGVGAVRAVRFAWRARA